MDKVRTEADKRAINEGCTYDQQAADRAIRFMETYCVASNGFKADQPVQLLDWQRQVISDLFGWMRKDGTRRFRSGYITCAKKNGKSFLCSLICLYTLLADDEPSPLVVSAACDRSQAGIIFDEMAYSINANTKLKKATKIIPSKKLITTVKSNGKYVALSADAPSKHGLNASTVIVDEFAFHKNPELYKTLKFSTISRRQPLFLVITTSGHDRTSAAYELYLYAKKIIQGVNTDTSFYACVFEAEDEECPIEDETNWHNANPSLEHTQSLTDFRQAAEAARYSIRAEMDFRQLRLNQWCSPTCTFLDLDQFDRCKAEPFPDLTGQAIYVGIDLASTTDLCGVTGIVPFNGEYYVIAHAFAPEEAARRRETQNLVRYQQFQAEGALTITSGNSVDYEAIRSHIYNLNRRYKVKELIFDHREANETMQILMQEGYTVFNFPQSIGYYNQPTKRLEQLVLEGKLKHNGSNLLRWQCQNLLVKKNDKDQIMPDRKRKPDHIDNFVALIMALSRATMHEQIGKPRASVYDSRGITFFG